MPQAFEKMVSMRYFSARRRERMISVTAIFSLLGIMIGVAALIVVMSVMNGFRDDLISRILGLNGHMMVYDAQYKGLRDYDDLQEKLENVAGVTSVMPIIEGQALMSVGDGNAAGGVVVRGLLPEDFARKPSLAEGILRADAEEGFGGDKIAIGKVMADRFHLDIGSEVRLVAPQGRASPFGTIPTARAFTVGVIFDVGMYEYNASFVFMPMDMAQRFYRMGDAVTGLEIMTQNPSAIDRTRNAVNEAIWGEAVLLTDWRQSNASFYTALKVERNVMFLILTLIILVAAFNIISSLIMLVKEKGRDIAILRTMGATRGMIVRIFFYTGAAVGILGTLLGAALGITIAANIESIRQFLEGLTGTELFADEIYFLSQLPSKLDYNEVIAIVLMALFLSLAATIYPAWKAARMDPVEALRHE
ncbi:MAG: lipoprotein-releasing ABC transporter permease subunit [Micavibrio sp.]|nr:MAG: lipoprotein-releasing ABC transporter permease subunit [Micavibrio sp.]